MPIRLVSELNGKLAKTSYLSSLPAVFLITIRFWSLSTSFMLSESANLTSATSSGEEAWNSTIDLSNSSGKVGVTLWQSANAVTKSLQMYC